MRVEDLGEIEGPILAFGGPYSNLQATQAILARAEQASALPLCTGDVVAYCGAPAQTVSAIRAAGGPVVAGNCEQQLAIGAEDCGCGFEDGSTCDLLSAGWYTYAVAQTRAEDRAWMSRCPNFIVFRHGGLRWGVLHGGVENVARFLWPTSDSTVFEDEWDAFEAIVGPLDRIVAGHSGIAFVRELNRGLWVNAGAIGMPPHDGRRTTRYAMIRDGSVALHELEYDFAAAVADMRKAGLTQGYDRALETGYWPSEDVLPLDLRLSLASG